MTVQLPKDVESSINAEVLSRHFASLDRAMAEAARMLVRDLKHRPRPPVADADPLLGSMSDHADLMDQIVEDAMRHREQQFGGG